MSFYFTLAGTISKRLTSDITNYLSTRPHWHYMSETNQTNLYFTCQKRMLRISHPDMFCKKGVLAKFTGKHLCQGLSLQLD